MYLCDYCGYKTIRKANYKRHCLSKKHFMRVKEHEEREEKEYDGNNASNIALSTSSSDDLSIILHEDENNEYNTISKKDKQIDRLTQLVETLVHENKGLQDKLVDMASEPKVVYNNNHNRTVNIIQYLNTECKHALNLSEFIESIPIEFKDIEDVNQHGYLKSVENTLVKSLCNLDKEKRPIHCTDKKRRQFYIKEQDQWCKDTQQEKTKNTIDKVNTKQLKALQEWKEDHPDWNTKNDKTFDKICDIQRTLLSMYSCDKKKQRMVNKIMGCLTEFELS